MSERQIDLTPELAKMYMTAAGDDPLLAAIYIATDCSDEMPDEHVIHWSLGRLCKVLGQDEPLPGNTRRDLRQRYPGYLPPMGPRLMDQTESGWTLGR